MNEFKNRLKYPLSVDFPPKNQRNGLTC